MKFTLSWLKDYLITKSELSEILDTMTMIGLEVESVDNPGEALKDFTIAKVTKAEKHPDADKLRVCTVETKDGSKQIVCGAPNAREGMTAVYAPLGTYIPGLDFALDKKPRKIRGVESHGMMCSAAELSLGEDHDGILDLEGDFEIGQSAASALDVDDPIIDFEVTPNRPDWLGVTGIARDLAAAGLGRFKMPDPKEVSGKGPSPVNVTIADDTSCPIFAGRVIQGVKNGPSPEWMQKRLRAVGINPKNMLVDITNYISLDRARPLHVYDVAKLKGNIHVRNGLEGESFIALDDKTYHVTEAMCCITDDSGVIGLGGIMGGASTGVSEDTVDVFIESAWFDPDHIARTGRDTGIISDARYRFERGVDAQSAVSGVELATSMILDVCGGTPTDLVVAGTVPDPQEPVNFKPEDVERLTGISLKVADKKKILKDLGFDVEDAGDAWYITPPSWRRDIEQSADFVEEVARIHGYDKLPVTSLAPITEGACQTVTDAQNRVRTARRVMAARGFLEAVTWSFVSKAEAAMFDGGGHALEVMNPVASELDTMRPSALPNLAKAAQRNADHGARDVRLFEAGPNYLDDTPKGQKMVISGLVRSQALRHWAKSGEAYDAYAAKADALAVLEALGMPEAKFQVGQPDGAYWHPGRSATLRLGPKNVVAKFGELHPRVLKALDIDGTLIAFEINLNALPKAKAKAFKTKPVLEKADLSPIRRDFAFMVKDDIPAGDVVRHAAGADKTLITDVSVFDVYAGKGIEDGHKSIAIEVVIQPRKEALTDDDILAISDKIVIAVAKGTDGVLRK